MPKSDVLKPEALIDGKYRVLRLLGEGAFGQVYEAIELRLDRRIALKTLFVDRAIPNMTQRFEREVELIKQIEHGNVVRLYDYGRTEAGQLYMSMEFVDGRELRQVLDTEGALGVERATNIALQVLDALAEAQVHDVVHRDLKPENILLTHKGVRKDVVKLLDFGIAKTIDPTGEGGKANLTGTGVSCGTPLYMAPEQFESTNIGPHTDMYAVGLILLEMITGTCPIKGESLFQIIAQHVQHGVEIPADVADLPVGQVIARALQKDWSKRYTSAAEMYAALQAATTPGPLDRGAAPAKPAPSSAPEAGGVLRKRGRRADGAAQGRKEPLGAMGFGATSVESDVVDAEPAPEVSGFFDGMLSTGEQPVASPHARTDPAAQPPEDDGDWWRGAVTTAIDGESRAGEAARPTAQAARQDTGEPVAGRKAEKATSQPSKKGAAPARSAPTKAETPPRRRGVVLVVAVALLLAVGGVGAFLAMESGGETGSAAQHSDGATRRPSESGAPAPARVDAQAVAATFAPASVAWVRYVAPRRTVFEFRIVATPSRATVLLDGRRICEDTPCEVQYDTAAPGKLEVARKGYETVTRDLSMYRSPLAEPLEVELNKL